MNTNKKLDGLPEYVLKTYQAGRCTAFAPGSVYKDREGYLVICPDTEGLMSLKDYLANASPSGLSAPISLIKALRLIAEARLQLSDWFIKDGQVSFDLEKLFVSPEKDLVKFLPGKGMSFSEELKCLLDTVCEELRITGAGYIRERILSLGTSVLEDKRGLLRYLSRWEEELRQ